MQYARNIIAKCCLGLTLLGLLSGCGKSVSKSDLPGTYVADYGFATDTISIKDNGQFVQTIKVKADGKVVTKNGTWQFNQEDQGVILNENYMLVVDGFSKMIPDFDKSNTNAATIGPVRRRFGKLEIGGDDWLWGRTGVEAPYKKQPSP
jgi:hypothetical protein